MQPAAPTENPPATPQPPWRRPPTPTACIQSNAPAAPASATMVSAAAAAPASDTAASAQPTAKRELEKQTTLGTSSANCVMEISDDEQEAPPSKQPKLGDKPKGSDCKDFASSLDAFMQEIQTGQ